MNVRKLPPTDVLKEALISFDQAMVSAEQVRMLVDNWPRTSVALLATRELGANERWDTAEAYMRELARPASIHARLKLWKFTVDWPEERLRQTETTEV